MKLPTVSRRAALCLLALAAMPLRANDNTGYRVLDFDWRDAARQRAVPVRLYLPNAGESTSATSAPSAPSATSATADVKPVPLVVFSHGIGGSRAGYRYLGSHWASQGWASLHLQHVGSDRQLWFGNVLGVIGRLRDAAQDAEAVARVMDLRFALDQLLGAELGTELAGRFDAQRIVAAGHSYGANTTLLAAGARVSRAGGVVDLHDPRIKAAIVISAPPFYGESALGTILAGVRVPSLHITATEDVIRIPGYFSGADDRVAVFDAIGSPRKALAMFEGGSHSMFTDRGGTGGALLNPQVKTATRELSVAFLKSVFDGEHSALLTWPQRFQAIVARFALNGLGS